MMYDFLVTVFGETVISGLTPEFLAVLCACVFLVVGWIGIKLFQAVGELL